MKADKTIKCGEIYWVDLENNSNNIQCGTRPCIVLGNGKGLGTSPTLQVIPITSKQKKSLPIHIKIACLPVKSFALIEQIQTINKKQISDFICTLDYKTLSTIKDKLLFQLGL